MALLLNKDVPSPTIFSLYIDELETYLDEIDGDSPCLLNKVTTILLYVEGVVLPSKSRVGLQRLLNKLHEFCTSSSLEVNLSEIEIMIFGRNKRRLNQEVFYLDKDQIESTHEYKCLGVDFYSHGYFHPPSKSQRITSMKAFMGTLRKELVIGVTCWELKSHLFKALVVLTFTYAPKSESSPYNYMLSSLLLAFNNCLPTYPPLG